MSPDVSVFVCVCVCVCVCYTQGLSRPSVADIYAGRSGTAGRPGGSPVGVAGGGSASPLLSRVTMGGGMGRVSSEYGGDAHLNMGYQGMCVCVCVCVCMHLCLRLLCIEPMCAVRTKQRFSYQRMDSEVRACVCECMCVSKAMLCMSSHSWKTHPLRCWETKTTLTGDTHTHTHTHSGRLLQHYR